MEDIKKLEEFLGKCNTTHVVNKGIAPLTLLGVTLVVLKALGYISISWFWVLTPFWLPVVLGLFLLFLVTLLLTRKDVKVVVVNEEVVDKTTTENNPDNTPVKSASTPVKTKKSKPKKKKEEVNNEESKESANTRVETTTNK